MSPVDLESGLSGRDHYADLYRSDLAREAEWLRRTAGPKADSVADLLRQAGLTPGSVLEVGAGTGAVIGALREREIGEAHYAVDFSTDAIDELRRSAPSIRATVADVTETSDPFGEGPYDVVVASHVIEHLEEPEPFLRALRDVPLKHLVAEVPLEDLPAGRLKARFKDRSVNPAGHVQFFTRRSFVDLLEQSGWRVLDVRVYAPVLEAEAFRHAYGSASHGRRVVKRLTERWLPRVLGPAWTTLYHAHCAALCVRA